MTEHRPAQQEWYHRNTQTSGRLVSHIVRELEQAGTPERAEKEKAYLKSALKHLGVPVPRIRKAVRAALRENDLGREALLAAVDALWKRKVHELRVAAVELLHHRVALLEPGDLVVVERLIREGRTWALADADNRSATGRRHFGDNIKPHSELDGACPARYMVDVKSRQRFCEQTA